MFSKKSRQKFPAPAKQQPSEFPRIGESREQLEAAQTRSLLDSHKRQVREMDDKANEKRVSQQRADEASRVRTFDEPERAHWARGTRRYSTPGTFEFNE